MLVNECIQGTEEWLQARLGIPTASSFDKIITSKGGRSAQSNAYMGKLLGEFIQGFSEKGIYTEHMERGNRLEPQARVFYSTLTESQVDEVGMVYLNDDKHVACSPDGLIADLELSRGLEIKCPMLGNHIGYMLDGKLPTKYKAQVQGSMWITGLAAWDFMSYHPDSPPFITKVVRDQEYIDKMESVIMEFSEELEELKTKYT